MLRAATDTGIRVLKLSKHINQNMQIGSLIQYQLYSTEKYVDNSAKCNVLHLLSGPSIQSMVFHKHSRQFSRSTILLHDIKCVTTSYYEDLGVQNNATSKEIKEAFYRLSKECHPDKVGQDNIEALLQFQAITEAYSTLSDPRLRRQYDRGVLGRASSAADRDASKHKVEGDAFIQGRAAFRDEYADGPNKNLNRKERLDHFTKKVASVRFQMAHDAKHAPSMAQPNAVDEHGRSIIRGEKSSRLSRQAIKGQSYAQWADGSNHKQSGGGVGFFLIVFVAILIIIVRKIT